MWAFMKAQGSAQDADAQHVYEECLRQPEMGLVEIITAEVGLKVRKRAAALVCQQQGIFPSTVYNPVLYTNHLKLE